MLSRSVIESDRKFWCGERDITSAQWVGLFLMFLVVAVIGIGIGYGFWVTFAVIVVLVLLGNRIYDRRSRFGSGRLVKPWGGESDVRNSSDQAEPLSED